MFLRILKVSFIDPFRSQERALIYAFSIVALIGFSFIDVYLGFYLAGKGFLDLTGYALMRTIMANIVVFSAVGWLLQHFNTRLLMPVFILLQMVGLTGLFLISPDTPGWEIALYMPLVGVPYWMAYHLMMVLYTSDKNRGNEVSVGMNVFFLGAVLGSLIAGLALEYAQGLWLVFTAAALIVIATIYFTFHLSFKIDLGNKLDQLSSRRPFLDHIRERPRRFLQSMVAGAGEYMTMFFVPAWIKIMGMSGLAAGLIQGLVLLMRTLVSPLTGHFVGKEKGGEIRLGGALITAGWVPWLFTSNPLAFGVSSLFWSAGGQLYGAGETSNWYKARSINAITAREMALGIGRSITAVLAGAVLFYAPALFPWLGLFVGILMTAKGYFNRKGPAPF